MLWSHLRDWPADQVYPPEVRRHMRMAHYLDAREGDLTGWRFPRERALMAAEANGDQAQAEAIREGIEEIDRVLRWMRNEDWPFR